METENNSAPLPGCLRTFDGVLAVGLNGGDVLLIDLCWQILDEGMVVILLYNKTTHFIF